MRTPPHPDRHCERKTAGHEQTRYLFNHNLCAGVAPRAERKLLSLSPKLQLSVPPPSLTHACSSPSLLSSLPLYLCPSLVSCLPPSFCLFPSLSLGPATPTPQWKPQVHPGLLKSLSQDSFVGIVTAAQWVAVSVSVCLSLFDLRGSFLEFIVFYCTWWGVGGLVLIGCVGTFRNFYQSHV